ncbi:LuxR C-terminal-related transcriptional regulator [Nocardia sp. NPDC004068]|uniref:LuxR C-terminal-related transcriptional regulator n=1 Tax=Nocardia sp. NPDC004068 TaxID=3364303 RepID=UPI0036AD9643
MEDWGARRGPDRLHGRAAEIEKIREFLAEASGDFGRVLVIDGARGMGKSRLLHEGLALARANPARPIVLGTDDVDSAALLLGSTAWAAETAGGYVALSAVLEVHPPPTSGYGPVVRADAYDRIIRVPLRPLDDAAAALVAADVLGATPEDELSAYLAAANGNPRLIVDLAAGLRAEGHLEIRGGRVALRSAALPERVLATVRAWLREHSEKCRQLLRAGAVLGPSFELAEALELLDETTVGVLPALTEALAAELLVSDDDRLAFPNEIVPRALERLLPVAARVTLLDDARRIRERSPRHADRRTPVPRTGRAELDRNAHAVAAVRNLVAAGRLDAAITLARSTLERSLPEDLVVELRCLLSDVLVMAGRAAEGVREAERVLTAAEPPSAHTAAVSGAALLFGQYMLDPDRARTRAQAVLGRRGLVGKDPHAVVAATVLSNERWAHGELREGLRWGRAAARGVDPDLPYAWPKLALATKLGELRRFDETEALIAEAAEHIDRLQLGAHLSAVATVRSRMLVQAGRLAEARDEARVALDIATELGTPLLVPLTHTVSALVALRSGDADAAAGHVRRCRAELATGRTLFRSPQYDWVELLVIHARSGAGAAAEFLTDAARGLESTPALLVQEPGAAAFFVRLAQLTGDDGLAERAVAAAERLAADNPEYPQPAVAAQHARGLLDRDPVALGAAIAGHIDPWARACAERHLAELDSTSAPPRPEPAALAPDADSGWHLLTDTERAIAELVGAGLTNRQVAKRIYVSPHTVNYHLRAIFRKLGVSSRIELVHHLYRRAT